jgi:hypothetical protein
VRQFTAGLCQRLESEGAVIASTPSAANKSLEDNSRRAFGFRLSVCHIIAFGFSAAVPQLWR